MVVKVPVGGHRARYCQAFGAKINLNRMRPDEILSMLYFAQNVPILSNKNSTKGRDDLAADSVFPVRAFAATAPGCVLC